MRLLIVSHVLPYPGSSGQQLRLRNTVEAAVREFDVEFLTYAPSSECKEVEAQLATFGCRPIVLPARLGQSFLARLRFTIGASLFSLRTGLKPSNYTIGKVEFSFARIRAAIVPTDYAMVLYEYFHAVDSVSVFQDAGVPVVLDMHNVLWKSRQQHMIDRATWPTWIRNIALRRYRQQEESAWDRFDALVAINQTEFNLVRQRKPPTQKLFYAPMGTDLSKWPASWHPAEPPKVAYYGALDAGHNEVAALQCHDLVMPRIWKQIPDAELWLVGSKPSDRLKRLTRDPRVKVTGFVEKVQDILRTMSLVLCPWTGTYGFRSRLVEVMALGVPVVASPAAVDGMELFSGRGIMLADSSGAMAEVALRLLTNREELAEQSRFARSETERLYSLENTYGRLMRELREWMDDRNTGATVAVRAEPES